MYLMYVATKDVDDDNTSTHSYHDGISYDDNYDDDKDDDDDDDDLLMMMTMMIF